MHSQEFPRHTQHQGRMLAQDLSSVERRLLRLKKRRHKLPVDRMSQLERYGAFNFLNSVRISMSREYAQAYIMAIVQRHPDKKALQRALYAGGVLWK